MTPPGHGLAAFDLALADRQPLAGVDEAGRGCLAGPVVAGAVVLPPGWFPAGLNDSKRLSPGRRTELYREIIAGALSWGAFCVSPRRIDVVNILRASLEAMTGAVNLLGVQPELVLVDGNQMPALSCEGRTLVGGDGRSACIAAGSVIAKVVRDSLMVECASRWPGYGFAAHKGYGAPEHLRALQDLGPCPLHRFSFRPVAELSQTRLW